MERYFRWVKGRYAPFFCALIAVTLSLPALWTGFLVDDDMHRAVFAGHIGSGPFSMFVLEDGNPEHLRAAQERGAP